MDTVECLGDAARGARECAVMGQAVTLARWIGSGRRPVTAGQVLRKADVPAAGAARLTGLRAVCAAESYPQDEDSMRLLAMALLTVLGEGGALMAGGLWQPVSEALRVLCDRSDRVRDVMKAGGTIAYTYDLGACWEHEITLEKTIPRDHSHVYPVCVEFRGDSPVEYWSEEEPEEPAPFGLKEVNRRLAALGREPE